MNKYEIVISYSDEDGCYVSYVPDLSGCMAHGSSEEEALRNAKEAIALWIRTALEFGDPIPEPIRREPVYAANT